MPEFTSLTEFRYLPVVSDDDVVFHFETRRDAKEQRRKALDPLVSSYEFHGMAGWVLLYCPSHGCCAADAMGERLLHVLSLLK